MPNNGGNLTIFESILGFKVDMQHPDPLARFKRRFEVKKKYAPPFKMFLFIFREASEKKIPQKMKFSGRC